MGTSPEVIRHLDEHSTAAWPALEAIEEDGWLLRFSRGVTRRGNSVWPRAPGKLDLGDKISRAEQVYRERGLRPSFQIGPLAAPANIDKALAERAYRASAPTYVQLARLNDLSALDAVKGATIDTAATEQLGEEWFSTYCQAERLDGREVEVRRCILGRVDQPSVYVLAYCDGQPAAVGRATLDGPGLGLFSIATRPEFRRRGAASAVLAALGRWGIEGGADIAFLQVQQQNTAACQLYAQVGFRTYYQYHYREAQRDESQ